MNEKEFVGYHEFGSKTEAEGSNFRDEISKLSEYVEKNSFINAEYGQKIGKLLFDQLELLYTKQDNLNPKDIEDIEIIYAFYRKILNGAEFMAVKNGFLAEFATARSLSKDAGFRIYCSTAREDTSDKIDLWVDMETGTNANVLALQIKCLSGVTKPQVINLLNKNEIEDFYDQYGGLVKNSQGFSINIEKMIQEAQTFENVVPAMIVLPSPESEASCFNAKTGKPNRELGEFFYEEIENKFMALEEVAA